MYLDTLRDLFVFILSTPYVDGVKTKSARYDNKTSLPKKILYNHNNKPTKAR